MKILGIGEIILDKSCLLQHYPEEGTKVQPMKTEYAIGGPVPAALILLARLGAECNLICSIGNDTQGQKLKKKLAKENVRLIPHLQKSTKSNTLLINMENGSRTIIRDSVNHSPIRTIPEQLLKDADLIIFDRHEDKAFDYVMANKRPDTKIIIDPSTEVSAKTIKMFELSDYPIIPIESLAKIRRHEDFYMNLDHLYEITQKPVVITAGAMGSIIYDGRSIDIIPAVEIECIDANGAGDIFRGAFAYGILNQWDLKKSTEFANVVAGLQCTRLGNGSAIPTSSEIFEFEKVATRKEVLIEEIIVMANN